MVQISDNGLEEIEKAAEKNGNASVMLLVLLIREVRELRKLLNKGDDAGNGSDYGTDSANNRDDRHE